MGLISAPFAAPCLRPRDGFLINSRSKFCSSGPMIKLAVKLPTPNLVNQSGNKNDSPESNKHQRAAAAAQTGEHPMKRPSVSALLP